MVGLSIILENHRDLYERGSPQVISKGSMIKSPTTPTPPSAGVFSRKAPPPEFSSCGFLEHCFLCNQKLLPGKDIYMYKGDKAFCSVECRCRQIFMDEEEIPGKNGCTLEYNCSMAATSSSSSSSSSGTAKGQRARNRSNAFAY